MDSPRGGDADVLHRQGKDQGIVGNADAERERQPDAGRKVVIGSENDEMVRPHSLLPKPEVPPGVFERSVSLPEKASETPAVALGKLIREKSNSVSAAITRRLSSIKKGDGGDKEAVKEFRIVGLKVTKVLKEERKEMKGRISFFSRSNCRDCGAVRLFFRERNLDFAEINVDVYPGRRKELAERTRGATVPQIFFNEKLIGGLVALNSLRNSGILEAKMEEILGRKCPDDAPSPPVYGFDEPEDEAPEADDMAAVAMVLRQKVPIQDRIMKMKFVKNCFSGADLVDALINHFDCGRIQATEIGKQLARKHFIHHVFRENEFEDGNHFYRFLEHASFVQKCHNFRGVVNDSEPKPAAAVFHRLTCLMSAIIESYASDDRRHLDYTGISNSEEFRRYVNLVEDLQRVNLMTLSHEEKLAFFLNLHNAMAMHAVIRIGHPGNMIDRRSFFTDFVYVIGGYPYSLSSIKNGILRNNHRPPFSLVKPFSSGDERLQLSFPKVNQLIHFGMWNATRGGPAIRFFTPHGVESELKSAARDYFQRDDGGIQVDLGNRTVQLPRLIKWYSADFGQEKQVLRWCVNYVDASKAGLLTHLLTDDATTSIKISYQDYDWSLDS